MKVDAAIFDMDGLLISSERISLALFLQMCEQRDLGNMRYLYLEILGTNDAETRRRVTEAFTGKTDPEQFLNEYQERYREETTTWPVPLMPGTKTLLEVLKKNRIKTAVATSTGRELALLKLTNSGIIDYFDTVTGGDQVANGKPAPDIYLTAASTLGILPERCIALEDSPNGVRAAVAAGMHTIQIPDLVQPDAELLLLKHTVLDSLDNVATMITTGQLF